MYFAVSYSNGFLERSFNVRTVKPTKNISFTCCTVTRLPAGVGCHPISYRLMILPGMLDGSANSNLPTTEIGELNCIERARTFVNELTVHAFTLKSTYIITYRI